MGLLDVEARLVEHPGNEFVSGSGLSAHLALHSYGHLPVITGYKWDYTFYKWGYKYL